MRKAVAVDFDGTLCVSDFPTILEPIPEAIEFVKQCNQAGVAVILWTCRTDEHLDDAMAWCYEQGIHINKANANLSDWQEEYHAKFPHVNPDGRKVAADLYIDDKANFSGIEWDKAFDWLRKVGYK